MNDWLSALYTWFSRIWDYISYVYDYIQNALKYMHDTVVNISSAFTGDIGLCVGLAAALAVILFVIHR